MTRISAERLATVAPELRSAFALLDGDPSFEALRILDSRKSVDLTFVETAIPLLKYVVGQRIAALERVRDELERMAPSINTIVASGEIS